MSSTPLRAALAAIALAVPAIASAQIVSISSEPFAYAVGSDLDNQGGGLGWANNWWAGGGAMHAVITAGGCDGDGTQATTNLSDQGSYRTMDLSGQGDVVDPGAGGSGQDVLGRDDTTIWVSFCAGRLGDDLYGGFSVFNQGCCEALFFGAPFMVNEWGLQSDPGGGGPTFTVPGSNIDTTTSLVYRVDFMAGPERVRLWLDPATAHPTSTPDLDVSVADFRFNEVRIQSGQGATLGYDFDAIQIEKGSGDSGMPLCFGDGSGAACACGNTGGSGEGCANSLGMGALLTASGSPSLSNDSLVLTATQVPNQPGVFFQGDMRLAAPMIFGDGLRCCGQGVIRIGTYLPSGNTTNTATGNLIGGVGGPILSHPGNANLMPGDSRCYQYWNRDPSGPCGSGFNLSNGMRVDIGA